MKGLLAAWAYPNILRSSIKHLNKKVVYLGESTWEIDCEVKAIYGLTPSPLQERPVKKYNHVKQELLKAPARFWLH